MMSSSLAASAAENAQKLKEAQLKIGMALKNAQYALTTHTHRSLTTALHENVSALTALSTYLSLSGSPVKAAAIAGQMAKILKSISAHVSTKERNRGGLQRGEESHPSSSANTSPSSSFVFNELGLPPDPPRETTQLVADLQRTVEELKQQRATMAEEKRALEVALEESQQQLIATAPRAVMEARSSEFTDNDADAVIRELRAKVDDLKHEVREEHMRAAALQDQLHEAEEQIEDQEDQVQALRLQLRLSQEEKLSQDAACAKREEEIKALQAALLQNSNNAGNLPSAVEATKNASGASLPPRGYVDKDDFDALKLQNQLLQQALREQETQLRPTDSRAVLTQQTLEELETDHQQQLEALKLTIQSQYNRETELIGQQRTMQDTIDDLTRQLQLSSNRQWVQQERAKHLNEMEEAQKQIEQLHETINNQAQQIQQQQLQLDHYATSQHTHSDTMKNRQLHQDENVAKLNQQLGHLQEDLNESHCRLQDLQGELDVRRTQTCLTTATAQQQSHDHQQEISHLTLTMKAEREQHDRQVAELQQALEVERDRAAASQSTVEQRESALQQQLAELRASMTAEREQHDRQVADLEEAEGQLDGGRAGEDVAVGGSRGAQKVHLDVDHSKGTKMEGESGEDERNAESLMNVAVGADAAEGGKVIGEQTAELKGGQQRKVAGVNRVCTDSGSTFTVALQPVDWLREENEALKMQVKEWEERHKEEVTKKMAAFATVRQTEQTLACSNRELQRLKDECAPMQKLIQKSLEERDSVVKKLKDGSKLAEEAQANLLRLETLRKELDEVQRRLDVAERDKALLASRYKRVNTEKEECAEAARKLLTQYKEMVAMHEKMMAQLAAAEALAAEKSREVEELTRAATVDADLASNRVQDDAGRIGAQKALENTVREKQEKIEHLVAELDVMARENKRLTSQVGNAQLRQVVHCSPCLTAEPTSTPSAFSREMLISLADMRVILSAMHAQLLPILETLGVQARSRASAAASHSFSASAVEALEELYTAVKSSYTATQGTLEDFDAMAHRLCVSTDLQGVVYNKLLAILQQPKGVSATSALAPPLVDVALVRACSALLGEACFFPASGWDEGVCHGMKTPSSYGSQRHCPGKICSAARSGTAAGKEERIAASTAANQKPLSRPHCHALSSAPTTLTSPACARNFDISSHTVSPARRRTDDYRFAMLSDSRNGRQPAQHGLQRRSSFGNFELARASISVAEERAGLRTAPTPPWK